MRKRLWIATILALLSGAMACAPEPEELVGVWVVTDDTAGLSLLPSQGRRMQIELHEDGRFTATGYPLVREAGSAFEYKAILVDGAGTWSLDSSGSWGVELRFTDGDAPGFDLTKIGDWLSIHQILGPPKLRRYVGDPDLMEVIYFEKI